MVMSTAAWFAAAAEHGLWGCVIDDFPNRIGHGCSGREEARWQRLGPVMLAEVESTPRVGSTERSAPARVELEKEDSGFFLPFDFSFFISVSSLLIFSFFCFEQGDEQVRLWVNK